MKDLPTATEAPERAILVGLITPAQNEARAKEYLDELEFLADTAGAVTVRKFTQKMNGGLPHLRRIRQARRDTPIHRGQRHSDGDLRRRPVVETGGQHRKELKIKVLDRTGLILDIFAKRARTANARTQVELASTSICCRGSHACGLHLERQRGGIGMRGGETQIETDRRIILDKISRLKEELRSIVNEVDTAQKPRQAHPRGSRGLHQRGQVDTDEPAEQKRRVCREQAVRHARHHRAQSDHRKSAVSAHRHRRVYPQTPDTPCGLLQIDSRRGARSRPAAACGRHLPSQLRGTDRSCQPYACRRVRIGRQADDHGVQQGRRLHLHAQGCRRPHSGTPREPVARRPESRAG